MVYSQDPWFDDIQLAQISEMHLGDLVGELVTYILFLRDTAANLRREVNDLSRSTNAQASPVYYEVYSDLCRTFEDTPAYAHFKKQGSAYLRMILTLCI